MTVDVGGLSLPHPVLTAAGCGGTGRELAGYLDLADLGAFTTRTVTLDARPGGPGPRVVEVPAGVLATTGLQNPGLQGFLATELPWLAQRGARTVVSVTAATLGEYGELANRVGNAPGVHAVEVNLAGAALAGTRAGVDTDPHQAGKVLHVVRREVPRGVAVLAKLTPGPGLLDVARSAVRNGADALVVGHGPAGLVVDPATLRPVLPSTATLGGPTVLAVALRAVWELSAELTDVPLVGCGGVRSGADAVAMLACGASAVQVGTAMLADPVAPLRVAAELAEEVAGRGLPGPAALVGVAHTETSAAPAPDPGGTPT